MKSNVGMSQVNILWIYFMAPLPPTVPPYVGMARKQNGGYNASISVQNADISPGGEFYATEKTVRSALWRCPNSTVALRLLENVD